MPRNMNLYDTTATSPRWAGDFGSRDHLVPGPFKLDAAQFVAPDAVRVVVGAAGAAGNATSVPVAALSGAIPAGTLLDFGGKKFARLSAAAAAAAITLTVDALATALVDGDTATYPGLKLKSVPSGTALGRTIAERDLGTGLGPADEDDDEVFLNFFDVTDVAANNDAEMYRPGAQVYENFLPGWSGLASGVQAKLRARYLCTTGV
jgi:hypothetical protein